MIDVLCCCKPENVMGQIALDDGLAAGLELRETVDEEDWGGVAFVHDEKVAIEAAGTKRKPTRRTWRGK